MEQEIVGKYFTLGFILEKLRNAGFEGISVDEIEKFEIEVCLSGTFRLYERILSQRKVFWRGLSLFQIFFKLILFFLVKYMR